MSDSFPQSFSANAEADNNCFFKPACSDYVNQISQLQYKTEQKVEVISCFISCTLKYFLINLIACNKFFALEITCATWWVQFSFESNKTPKTFIAGLLFITTLLIVRSISLWSFLQKRQHSVDKIMFYFIAKLLVLHY